MGDATAVTTFHYFEYGVLNGIKKMEKKAEWHPPSSPELEWKKIDVLIIDEAHNLPDSLVDFFTVKASSKWPRFDFSNFMTSIDRAKDAHPDDVSASTFMYSRNGFDAYYKQEEKRVALLDEVMR